MNDLNEATTSRRRRRMGSAIAHTVLAVLLGAAAILLLRTQGRVFVEADLLILLFWIPGLLFIELWRRQSNGRRAERPVPRAVWPLYGLAFTLVLFLFSSIIRHKWFYFLHWLPQAGGEQALQSTAFWFVLLTLCLSPLLLRWPQRLPWWLLAAGLFVSQFGAFERLFHWTGGSALVRDDHPSFIFRLWQFRETFPKLTTYNPYWNGGVEEFYHVVSGTLAPGLFLWPLWHFGDIVNVYTTGVGILFILLVPAVVGLSMRAVTRDRLAPWIAAFLALGVSQHFYLWFMQFGTIGANSVAAWVVPAGALLYRVVYMERLDKWTGFFLTLSGCVLLLYPPGAVMAVPILVAFLVNAPRWTWPKVRFVLICGALVVLIHFRTILLLLLHDDVFRFFLADDMADASPSAASLFNTDTLAKGGLFLLAHLREGHPLLLIFGIAGVCVAPRRSIRAWYIPILLTYAVLAGWGEDFAMGLQLSRMAIPLLFASVVPATLAITRLLRTNRPRLVLGQAAVIVLLLLTGLNTYRLYDRQGYARYHSMMPAIEQLAAWIEAETPADGRFLFAGATVHAYGGGHVALLPMMAQREMMASDYYHFSPAEVDYEFPPAPFRDDPDLLHRYFDLYNVTAIATWHPHWMRHFRARPDRYEEVYPWGESTFAFFRLTRPSSLFHANSGQVMASFRRITVTVDDPNEHAVIAYNWADRLHVNPPAELFPYDAGHDVTLIGIRPNGASEMVIRHRYWL